MLAWLLEGYALEVHQKVKAEKSQKYENLKAQYLERLMKGGYRIKFKHMVTETCKRIQ